MRKAAKDQLTPKEEELMQLLWEHGPATISRLVELYPEPRPHFNTVSTVMRRLEAKGFTAHNDEGGTFHYGAVSALVDENKISADELKELLRIVERKGK